MEQATYYNNKLKALNRAVKGFSDLMQVNLSSKSAFEQDVYKNAAVQKFEYCIELFWKVAKLYLLLFKGIDESSPRSVIKAFYRETGISNDTYELLLKMILHRNLLSHLYDPLQFEEIYDCFDHYSKILLDAVNTFKEYKD